MRLRSLRILPTSNQMERNSSGVLFMDAFSDPMCFGILYNHLDRKDKATLRLVCKELRDAVNLNARGLEAVLEDDYKPVNMPLLISKLPNLESIFAIVPFYSGGVVSVCQGAQLARKLTKLELRDLDEEEEVLTAEERERRAEVLDTSFGTINHIQWPLLQSLIVRGLDTTVSTDAVKGLLRLSTLTDLDLSYCRFKNESFNLIQPDSWPCLRHLQLDECRLEDPAVAIRALLGLSGLEKLSLDHVDITGEALAQIQPGSWPNLQVLVLRTNHFGDDPVGAMKGLLRLTSLQDLNLGGCDLSGEAISQIKPGDWPHLQKLNMLGTDLSDDPVGAMKGLLHLTALTELVLTSCILTGEAISQIKPGDWPHLQKLEMYNNDLSDDPVGAMKGLLRLTSLQDLGVGYCKLTGEAISQIKPGDWPHLQKLEMSFNNISDDPVAAMQGLLRLTSLQDLNVEYCKLTGEAISQIKPGDWPHLQKLEMSRNDLSDDKEGAMKGLLHLTSLSTLDIMRCGWNREEAEEVCRALGVK